MEKLTKRLKKHILQKSYLQNVQLIELYISRTTNVKNIYKCIIDQNYFENVKSIKSII